MNVTKNLYHNDNNQNLITASDNLKANLKTYLAEFMLVTDSINIKDAFVVNIGVNYDIKIRALFIV